jgi:transposase-like protein
MPKSRQWTPEEDARLLALQAAGHSAEGIVEHLPVRDGMPYSRHQIIKRCRELGIKPRGRRFGPGARFNDREIERMQRAYQAGATMKQLAKDHGCGPETIRQMVLAGILARDTDAPRADPGAVRAGTAERPRSARPACRAGVPDAPSSDLWRLWERAEQRVRAVAA